MSDKLWIDDICELVSLDINPIGKSMNGQLNIITKLALLISIATSISNRNTESLKRTIGFISIIMVLYIFLNSPFLKEEDPPTQEVIERYAPTININNPVNNRELKTNPELSSPATGYPQGSISHEPYKILGTSLNTDNWRQKAPGNDDSRNSGADEALILSPEIEAALTHNMPLDPSDEFYGTNFSRQIYKVPDDQGNYANQLYEQGPRHSCKQGSVFSYLGNPYTVYSKQCSLDNGYGQARRSGLHLPAK